MKQELSEIIEKLPKVAHKISVEYYGSGDSGDFEQIVVEDSLGTQVHIEDGLEEELNDTLYDVLESEHSGWEINEGSSGTITVSIPDKKVIIDHNEYYQESRNEVTEVGF